MASERACPREGSTLDATGRTGGSLETHEGNAQPWVDHQSDCEATGSEPANGAELESSSILSRSQETAQEAE
jgi:hypothetical protein